MHRTSRRSFLHTTAATVAGAWAVRAAGAPDTARAAAAPAGGTPKKAVLVSMLPKELSMVERFKLAKEVGFEATEVHTVDDPKQAEEMRAAQEASGLKIHSIMNEAHWQFPISSADPEVVRKSVAGMETSLRNAALFKAGSVLRYGFEIYNPNTSGGQRPQVTSRIRVFREGKLLFEGKDIPVITEGQTDLARLKMTGAMTLPTAMAPGDYVLQTVVTDKLAKTKQSIATQYIQFEIQ